MVTGILVEQGRINFSSALLVTLFGFSAGAITAYMIGRHLGQPFFIRCGKLLHIFSEQFAKAQTWLDRSAPAFIVFGRFVPGLSNLTPYMAGVSRIRAAILSFTTPFSLWGGVFSI